jgi:hypothetical protein
VARLTGSIDYAKKKEKRAMIKSQKDEMVRGDATYKSHTIHVGSGESPNSGESSAQCQCISLTCSIGANAA